MTINEPNNRNMANFEYYFSASGSGTVITGALFLGYKPEDAAKFSIYLSIPTLLGAMFFGLLSKDILTEDIDILMTITAY